MTDLKKEIYWKLEPRFLWDYLSFGVDLRDYNALQVSEGASSQNYLGRKLAFISVFREMMAGFEDIAALLLALKRRYGPDPKCSYQKEFAVTETPLFYTLVTYRESRLDKVLGSTSPDEVYRDFHFEKLVPVSLSEPGFLQPEVVRRGLLTIAKFLCDDCLQSQTKNNRPEAYNKIKHGSIVLSEGRDFFPDHPSGPAIIMGEPKGDVTYPLRLLILPYSEEEIENMKRVIWLSKVVRKVLLVLYLWAVHEQFVRAKDVRHPSSLFDADMRKIIEYAEPDHSTDGPMVAST